MIPSGDRIELFKGKGFFHPWYLRYVAANGQTMWVTEGYFSKWNAKRAYAARYSGSAPLVDTSAKAYRKYGGW